MLQLVQGIDLQEGIRNSGDEETLKEVMGGFLDLQEN